MLSLSVEILDDSEISVVVGHRLHNIVVASVVVVTIMTISVVEVEHGVVMGTDGQGSMQF